MTSQSIMRLTCCLFLCIGLSVAFGCSSEPPKFTVTGMVTLDGMPVKDGAITFKPLDGGHQVVTGKVLEGSYELACSPGEKNVMIAGFTEGNKLIPYTYVTEPTGLSAEVNEDMQLDFELSSKVRRRR